MHGIKDGKALAPVNVFMGIQIFGIDFSLLFCFPVANSLKVTEGEPYYWRIKPE